MRGVRIEVHLAGSRTSWVSQSISSAGQWRTRRGHGDSATRCSLSRRLVPHFFFREQGMYVTILSRCRVIYLARGVFMRVDVSDETVNTLRDARFFGTEGPCEATVVVHLQQAVPRSVPPCLGTLGLIGVVEHKACVSDHKTLCFQTLRCSEDQICVGVCCRKSSAFFCIHSSV